MTPTEAEELARRLLPSLVIDTATLGKRRHAIVEALMELGEADAGQAHNAPPDRPVGVGTGHTRGAGGGGRRAPKPGIAPHS